jgi:hypothetical protein
MCKTLTEGTICAGSFPYLCKCPSLQYYNNVTKKCEAQLMNGFVCLAADACRSDRGLICKNSICQCDSTKQFWSAALTICKDFYTYDTGTCTADNECNNAGTKLICRTSGTSCNCPLTVASGKCDCPTRVAGLELLWNGTACVDAGEYGDSCVIGYQCQELTELLKCDTCSTFKCVCSDCLWDSGNEKCAKCSAGWSCHNSACYTAVSHSSSICSNSNYNGNTSVVLSPESDWTGCKAGSNNWCNFSCCKDFYLASCSKLDCNGKLESHGCGHSHAFLCKFSG